MSDNEQLPLFDMTPEPTNDASYIFATTNSSSTNDTYDADRDSTFRNRDPIAEARKESSQTTAHGARGVSKIPFTKGAIFRQLNSSLTLNDFGLPDFIYRSDLIPMELYDYTPHERNDYLEAAVIPINWDHGYPATENNVPLWEQLPGESLTAYNAFLSYLELPKTSDHEHPVRMLPLLAEALGIELSMLSDYSHMFYWTIRFRAYDLYLTACHQKQREQRIMSIEGKHFTMAERYLNKLDIVIGKRLDHTIEELQDSESAIHDDLKLKDLVDMVDKLSKIQRVSVGLPANGAYDKEGQLGGRHQQVDDSFKEIAANAMPAKKTDNRSANMDKLLASPEDLARAQDLIIRSSR